MVDIVDDPGREFSPRDEAILTQLAALASVAISNATLYERERTIARTLQRSLRPGALPEVPGLAAAVRFRPAGENIELGGDFYDLFRARDGGWAALIGDVQGKGPDAAAVTALARHTLRAAAAYEHRPERRARAAAPRPARAALRRPLLHRRLRLPPGRGRARPPRAGLRRASAPARRAPRRHGGAGRPAGHAAGHRHRPAAGRRHRRAAARRRARALHRRGHRGPAPAHGGVRHAPSWSSCSRAAAG